MRGLRFRGSTEQVKCARDRGSGDGVEEVEEVFQELFAEGAAAPASIVDLFGVGELVQEGGFEVAGKAGIVDDEVGFVVEI